MPIPESLKALVGELDADVARWPYHPPVMWLSPDDDALIVPESTWLERHDIWTMYGMAGWWFCPEHGYMSRSGKTTACCQLGEEAK